MALASRSMWDGASLFAFAGRIGSTRANSLVAACLAAVAIGCGEPERGRDRLSKNVVPVEKVPAELMEVAKKELPEVTFDSAWQNLTKSGELNSYEIRGKQSNGKVREVRVGLDGKVLERE